MKDSVPLKLTNDFFNKPRPSVTNKETFKDVIPFDWGKEALSKLKNKEKKVS